MNKLDIKLLLQCVWKYRIKINFLIIVLIIIHTQDKIISLHTHIIYLQGEHINEIPAVVTNISFIIYRWCLHLLWNKQNCIYIEPNFPTDIFYLYYFFFSFFFLQALFASCIPEIIDLIGTRPKYGGTYKNERGRRHVIKNTFNWDKADWMNVSKYINNITCF